MGAIIGGASQIAGSLIGGRARRREATAAKDQYGQDLAARRNFQFTNNYKNAENVFEDATINQQAQNTQNQATDASLASGLDAIVQGGGGAGSAQAIANASLQASQGANSDIARQEQQNQQARLNAQAGIQDATLDAENELQARRHGQAGENLALSTGRHEAAQAARDQATQQLVGGIGQVAGGVASGGLGPIGKIFG